MENKFKEKLIILNEKLIVKISKIIQTISQEINNLSNLFQNISNKNDEKVTKITKTISEFVINEYNEDQNNNNKQIPIIESNIESNIESIKLDNENNLDNEDIYSQNTNNNLKNSNEQSSKYLDEIHFSHKDINIDDNDKLSKKLSIEHGLNQYQKNQHLDQEDINSVQDFKSKNSYLNEEYILSNVISDDQQINQISDQNKSNIINSESIQKNQSINKNNKSQSNFSKNVDNIQSIDNINSLTNNRTQFREKFIKRNDVLQKNKLDSSMDTTKTKILNINRNSTKIRQNLNMNEVHLQKYNQTINQMNNYNFCTFIIDEKSDIQFQNRAASEQLFQDKHELLENKIYHIIPINFHQDFSKIINQQILSTTEESSEMFDLNIIDKNLYIHKFSAQIQSQIYENIDGYEMNLLKVYCQKKSETNCLIIDPRNSYSLIQSSLMFMLIIILIFYDPYIMTFNDEDYNQFQFVVDMIVSTLFGVDIVINFITAYEQTDDSYIFDFQMIAYNQLCSQFLFDILAAVPFDHILFFDSITSEIDLPMSLLKVTKILKLFKVLRLIKISNALIFNRNRYKNIFGDEIIKILKKFEGFINLVKQNMLILIGSHYQTIVFQQIKSNFITPNNEEWLSKYQNIKSRVKFKIYLYLLENNVKTALGLGSGANQLDQSIEIFMQMVWLFIGLSLFGQGIGNISSQLNHTNQLEVEVSQTKNQFKELCEIQSVDPRVTHQIEQDLEKHYHNQLENDLQEKGKMLSEEVLKQLETQIYRDFIDSFNLFYSLGIPLVRMLKLNSIQSRRNNLIKKGDNLTQVQFVTKGNITFQDDKMKIVDVIQANEFYGFRDFLNQVSIKYDYDFPDLLYKIYDSQYHSNHKLYLDQIVTAKDDIKRQFWKKNDSDMNSQNKIEDNDIFQFYNQFLPIHSYDIEQFTISYDIMESIIQVQFDSFLKFQFQQLEKNAILEESDKIKSRYAMMKFEDDDSLPAFILMESGLIQEINQNLEIECPDFSLLKGNNIKDYIEGEHLDINEIKLEDLSLCIKDQKYNLSIDEIEDQQIAIIDEQISNQYVHSINDDYYTQQDLKKSLNKAKIYYFNISTYIAKQ